MCDGPWVTVATKSFDMVAGFFFFFSSMKSIYNWSYLRVWTIHLQCCWKCLWRELVLDITGWIQWRLSAAFVKHCLMCFGTAESACRCSADVRNRLWVPPYCSILFKGICVGICVNSDWGEPRGGEKDMLSPSLSSCGGGCLSRRGCRRRGSKLIIQHAVNVSKASVGKLRRSEGPFSADAPKHTRANVIIMGWRHELSELRSVVAHNIE